MGSLTKLNWLSLGSGPVGALLGEKQAPRVIGYPHTRSARGVLYLQCPRIVGSPCGDNRARGHAATFRNIKN